MRVRRPQRFMAAQQDMPARNKLGWAMQDLLQYKDRDRWYLPTFHADDAPDWNPGSFLRSRQLAPGIREVLVSLMS